MHIRTYIDPYKYVCICTHIFVCICEYIYRHVYMYIHIHTYFGRARGRREWSKARGKRQWRKWKSRRCVRKRHPPRALTCKPHSARPTGDMWTSHVTYEWVMSHRWMSLVAQVDESCRTGGWVMSHRWMSHVEYEEVMPHMWMCRVKEPHSARIPGDMLKFGPKEIEKVWRHVS